MKQVTMEQLRNEPPDYLEAALPELCGAMIQQCFYDADKFKKKVAKKRRRYKTGELLKSDDGVLINAITARQTIYSDDLETLLTPLSGIGAKEIRDEFKRRFGDVL